MAKIIKYSYNNAILQIIWTSSESFSSSEFIQHTLKQVELIIQCRLLSNSCSNCKILNRVNIVRYWIITDESHLRR